MGRALPGDRPRSIWIRFTCVRHCSFLTGLLSGVQTSQERVMPNASEVNQYGSRITDQ